METKIELANGINRMFDLISILTSILRMIVYVVYGYCMQYYYGKFLKSRLVRGGAGESRSGNEGFRKGCLTGLLVMAAALLQGLIREALISSGSEWIYYGVYEGYVWSLGFMLFVGVVLFRLHEWKTLFVILSFGSVEYNADLLVGMELLLDDRVRKVLGDWLEVNRITVVEFVLLWVALSALYMFLFYAVFYLLLRRIVKNFREKELTLHGREILQLLIPSLTGLCLQLLLRMQVYKTEEGFYVLYASNPFLGIVVTLILFLNLLSILHGVTMFQDMYALNRERKGRAVLEKQVSALQEYVGERERIWSGVRGLKHDMRNTLSVAMRIAEKGGEGERLQAYLEQLSLSLDAFETEFRTGNVVADALLDMKCHEARKRIPELQVEVEELAFPGTLAIQDYDIGVILGNALDNAVEACERLHREEPGTACFIRLSSFLDGEMFLMEIRNNFDGKLITREGKEFPDTGKADGESHGIGLANIKSTCEKYHGTVEWKARDGVFTLSVMLRNTNAFDHEYKF